MKKRLIALLLLVLCIFTFFACNSTDEPPVDIEGDLGNQEGDLGNQEGNLGNQEGNLGNQDTPEPQTTVEYGYEQCPTKDERYVSYRIAYKVDREVTASVENPVEIPIKISHGASGPWLGGGYVHPNVERIEIVFEETVLYQKDYFDYIDRYFYRHYSVSFLGTYFSHPKEVNGEEISFYSSEVFDSEKHITFSNEEEYFLDFTNGNEEYTFQIREIYFDASVKVVCEAKLYARFEGDKVHFSTEPFDEAE